MMKLALGVLFACLAQAAPAADVIKGAQIYRQHCAGCHGVSGLSPMPNAPNFARGEKMMQPDQALRSAIRAGRGAMPAYQGVLSDRDTLDVISYLRTLR